MKIKYPKTFHLPFSPGLQNDDRVVSNSVYEEFKKKIVVVSEKMDGENSTVYTNDFHARSLDSNNHPSRNWIKGYVAEFQWQIPEGWRFVFENCFAVHSVKYTDLPTYAFLLNIWSDENECLSFENTVDWMNKFNLHIPKVYYLGLYDEDKIIELWESLDKEKVEGLVIRNVESFDYNDFQKNVLKIVRKNHVQTDEHWMSKPIEKNGFLEASNGYIDLQLNIHINLYNNI